MPTVYSYNDDGYYKGVEQCPIDPLETIKQNQNIYIVPANSTNKEPLPAKEGFKVKFDKTSKDWIYEEEPKTQEPEPYVPTEKDRLNEELWKAKGELQSLDYIGIKIATGRATREEYSEQIARMTELAEKVNEVETQLKELEEAE